jgi:cell division protein FtsI/penicillin-binding protein 2
MNFNWSPAKKISIHEMIVSGSDQAGRDVASRLRKSAGARAVLTDLKNFGFPYARSAASSFGRKRFWVQLDPAWIDRLIPDPSRHSITDKTSEAVWNDVMSIGESNFWVTPLSISRFLQAVGNEGTLLPLIAGAEMPWDVHRSSPRWPQRILKLRAATKLQSAMRDVVQRGTAKSIAPALANTDWSIGGKTGSGGSAPVGPQSDGWFAGLVFDSSGKARFTVATFVRHGGPGGGNNAKLSAELARYLISAK